MLGSVRFEFADIRLGSVQTRKNQFQPTPTFFLFSFILLPLAGGENGGKRAAQERKHAFHATSILLPLPKNKQKNDVKIEKVNEKYQSTELTETTDVVNVEPECGLRQREKNEERLQLEVPFSD